MPRPSFQSHLLTVQKHQPQVRTHSSLCPRWRLLQAAPRRKSRRRWPHGQRQEHAAGCVVPPYSALRRCHCYQPKWYLGMFDACANCTPQSWVRSCRFVVVHRLIRVQSADLDALRNQLSIVPQEPAMFSGTLRENIDPFVRYSDAAVAKAIKDCGLEGRALDATVEVSGENFSLGEKQLVRLSNFHQPLHALRAYIVFVLLVLRHGARRSAWRACS